MKTLAGWTLAFSGPDAIPPLAGNGTAVLAQLDTLAYADGQYAVTLNGSREDLKSLSRMLLRFKKRCLESAITWLNRRLFPMPPSPPPWMPSSCWHCWS